MVTAFILLFLGLLAILVEFFVPGGILAGVGALLVLASIFFFAADSNSIVLTLLYFFISLAAVIALIKFILWRLRQNKSGAGIYSNAAQEGYTASTWDRSLLGKMGTVSTDLKPGGHILIEGKRQQAISVSGYIVKGGTVIVVGGEGESLLVKQHNKETAT